MMTNTHRELHQRHVERLARMASKAVPDEGIDLKRKKAVPVVVVAPEPPPAVAEKPVVQDVPISDYGMIQEIRIGRLPPHKTIQATVCRLHGNMPMATMLEKCRWRTVVDVRHLAIFVSRILRPRDGLMSIGRAYGGRDHATIIHAVKRMRQKINNETVAQMVTRALDLLRADGWTVPDSLEQAMIPVPPLPKKVYVKKERLPLTHCRNGHEYTEESAPRRRDGTRSCKKCILERYQRISSEAGMERQRGSL